ncbi:MAG: hypothetical protein Q4P78_03485 [Rothia sp. (in: high G+C Gram-positive bacteria)]|uniref:hypothetical protein n=1 Tax=Rothia sp. (in: high G+C Gram-positive bacteria) TaxID=1885016 RepID=UPI0026DF19BC|nr:hypothetical protein [Rothia sp. (in: high G+C Gram-positive bacteria)]MDO5750252.1 hypothetical protein [Rothia sp. (in: high G+C Gram-positive bacteria)]
MGIFGFGKKKQEDQTPLDPQAHSSAVESASVEGSSLSDKVMEQQQWEESLRRFVKAEGERHHGSHPVEEKAAAGASDRESFFEESADSSESVAGESVETESAYAEAVETEAVEPAQDSEDKSEQAESSAEATAEDAIAKINSLLSSMHSSNAENKTNSEEDEQKAQALRTTELDLDTLAAERNARLGISEEELSEAEDAEEAPAEEAPADIAQAQEPAAAQQSAVESASAPLEAPAAKEDALIEDSAAFTQAAVSAAEEAAEEDTTPTLAESDPLYQLLVLMRSYGHGQLTFDLRLLDSDMHYRLYHRGTQTEQGIVLPGIKFFEPVAALYTRAQRSSEQIWNRALIVASPDAQGHVSVQASYMSADGSDRTESFIFPGEESATEAARIQVENEEGPQTRQALGQAAVAAGLAPEPYPFEHDYDSDSGTEGQILRADSAHDESAPDEAAEPVELEKSESVQAQPAAQIEEAEETLDPDEAEDSTEAALAAIIAGADARLAHSEESAEETSAESEEETVEEAAESVDVESVAVPAEEIESLVAEVSESESIDSLIVSELSEDDFAAEYPVEDLGASAEEETPLLKLDDITTPVDAEGSVRAPGLAQASAQLSQLTAPVEEPAVEEATQSDSELAAAYGVEELPAFLADESAVEESAADEPAAETPAETAQSESSENAHSLFEDFSTPAASLVDGEEGAKDAPAADTSEKTEESEPALPASLADIAPEEEEDLLPPMQASTEGLQLAVGLNEMPPAVAEPDTPARSAQVPAPSDIELAEGNLVLTQAQVARHLAPVAEALFGEHGTAKDATAVLIRVRALGSYYDALTHVRRGGFWEQVRTFDLVPEELLDIPGLKTASYSEGDGSPLAMSFSFTPGVPVQARFDYSNEQAFVSYPRALEAERSVEELRMFPRLGAKIPVHMAQALAHWNL